MTVREHLLAACLGLVLPTIAAADPATAAANAAVGPNETAKTATAVMAIDQHWLEAEVGGDTTWLNAMLMPDYRTVGADGKVGDKAAILRSAMKNRGSDKIRKEVDAWQKTHPTKQSVVLHGNVAILSFSDPKTGHILSSDTFIYQDGGWHALYSQHSKVADQEHHEPRIRRYPGPDLLSRARRARRPSPSPRCPPADAAPG